MENISELSSIHEVSSDEEQAQGINFENLDRKRRFIPSNDDEEEEEEGDQRPGSTHPTSTPLNNSYVTASECESASDYYVTAVDIQRLSSLAPKTFIMDEDSLETIPMEEDDLTEKGFSSSKETDVRNPSPSSFTDEFNITTKGKRVRHWRDIPEDVLLNLKIPVTKHRRLGNPVMDKVIKEYLESRGISYPDS